MSHSYAGRDLPNQKLESHLDLAYDLGQRDRRDNVPRNELKARIRQQYKLVGQAVQVYLSGYKHGLEGVA